MTQSKFISAIKQYGTLLLGSAILAFGLFNVHSQSQITEGGVLGATLLLDHWFGISPGITGPVMDCICYFFGYKLLGKAFLKYALTATCGFAAFYNIFEFIGPVLPNMGGTPVLAAIVGGIFVGVGVGLVVRAGGASGGDDALGLMIAHYFKCNISKAYFLTDFVVLILSLSYVPVPKILCSLITVTLSSFIIGRIHIGKAEPATKKADIS
ncbi:MAG: YitT family protein [Angelakisella sp.]